ncbi:hypothetical protein LCGC14_0484500 [marine sediment metagenome]|uniref:CTP synthase n=1 Tax=marine sediment metagenome TaxID=412755 RepID=A0A0F9UVF5_9ZZZZ|nr:CTP synthase [Actinomycetota bacterium]
MTKHIFVTGGVVSSLGKGITAASIGLLLKNRGLKVSIQKLDPYLNLDPGTMSPFQHGEVFVTADGTETDLDLGHYERFIDESLTKHSNVTAGSIYWSILKKERKGSYLGGTVQIIPHVTNEIKESILTLATDNKPDVAITEVGGTVGDIESLPFLEAIRQLKKDVGKENVIYVHVTLVPFIGTAAELKTKPTQHSVKELRSIGIQPDLIVCRADRKLTESAKRKIALFCDIDKKAVIEAVNVKNIYEIPLSLNKQKADEQLLELLSLNADPVKLDKWQAFVDKVDAIKDKISIAIVGKYVQLPDAYLSVYEALNHAGINHNHKIDLQWVDAEELTPSQVKEKLKKASGILVPGGFGVRGIEGKIAAAKYARENNVPYLGICLGMQCAVVEFARNVAGLKKANSSEFQSDTPYPVIDLMEEQKDVEDMGASMRLGNYPCTLMQNTLAKSLYKKDEVQERHRHRYEVNNKFRQELEKAGMVFSGRSPDEKLIEMIELKDHPYFIASQFHPEFKSRPIKPHPLFNGFVGAAIKNQKKIEPNIAAKL